MAYNSVVGSFNKKYLSDQIRLGKYDMVLNTFEFNTMDRFGNEGGYKLIVHLNNGLVSREDMMGHVVVRGLSSDSNHKQGYITVEICTPFDEDVHFDTAIEKLNVGRLGRIMSVNYTCYLHVLIGLVIDHIKMTNHPTNWVINHIDGCPLHNWASNLEYCSRRDNALHGVVVNSIFRGNVCPVRFVCNNVTTFPFVDVRKIPAHAIVKYMAVNDEFNDAVTRLYKQVRDRNCKERDWLTDSMLMNFIAWGLSTGEIQ